LEDDVLLSDQEDRVDFLGWLDRARMQSILKESRVGLVLFHPTPNHLDSQPNKLFEYMSAGIPVVASDFSTWRKLVEEIDCGLLVDPLDPTAIADAIQWLLEHPQEAEAMGKRGQEAVQDKYNWSNEAKKLLNFYRELLET
jgi:glycosyltransferase involved in cell wall biosynthesis